MTSSVESKVKNPKKIVLVDDTALVLRVHAEMLKEIGYVPFTFESPEDALSYLSVYREHVSMVISDYRMPQMNGLDFIGRFRCFDSHTPAALLTGYATEVDAEVAKKHNVKVLHKPIKLADLREHVQTLLSDL